MAFFALLEPSNVEEDGDYEAERCHINVWSLPGLLGHRPMAFDVGVLLKTKGSLKKVEIALPVRTAPRLIDLSDTLKNTTVGALLFGKTYYGNSDNQLQLKLDPEDPKAVTNFVPLRINAKESNLVPNDRELTVATLTFAQRPASDTLAYLRVRFVVDHAGSMWRWQRVLGRRNGVLIDFRAPDPREESRKDRGHLEGRAKAIGELDAFFMLPERYRLQSANPELKYTRTLEGKAWDPYLRRSLNGLSARRGGHQRLMVHRWHPETPAGKPKPVDRTHPFRGFLQFNREPAFTAPSDLGLVALLTALFLYVLFRPLKARSGVETAADWFGDRVADLAGLGARAIIAAGAIAAFAIALRVVRRRREFPVILRQAKRLFKRMEYAWFWVLGRK